MKTKSFRYCCLLLTCVFLQSIKIYGQCDCDHIIGLSPTEWLFDGNKQGVKPGDKVCLTSGTRSAIGFVNIHGTEEKPVIITNMYDGKVTISAPATLGNVVSIEHSSHFIFSGAGNEKESCGIEITGGQMGLNVQSLSTNFEVNYLNIFDVGCCGIVVKTDPTCDQATWRGHFTLENVYLHHNEITNTGCEGMYIGNSHYDTGVTKTCDGKDVLIHEHDLINVKIAFNLVRQTGGDGIQVGSTKKATLHHNQIYNVGKSNQHGHLNGLQAGGGTEAIAFNNIIRDVPGFGIFDSGGGGVYYNNLVTDTKSSGILLNDEGPNWSPTGFLIFNNTLINCEDSGVILFSENTAPSYFFNNIVVSPDLIKRNSRKVNLIETNNILATDISSLMFIDPEKGDFHLQKSSPAIDRGNSVSTHGISFDLDGSPRLQGVKCDIGAYEFQF